MSRPNGEGATDYNEAHVGASDVRFVPSVRELIHGYLQRKLQAIRELDKSFEGSWYFFSPRRRKYGKGERPRRKMGDDAGFWKSTVAKTEILGADGKEVIGYKCGLTFHEYVHEQEVGKLGKRKGIRRSGRCWSWSLSTPPLRTTCWLLNDCMLCKTTNKSLEEEEGQDPGLSQSTEEKEEQQ
ncbi:NAC domain-containing protein JA2L-like [Phragmites australis]|uniref:NAC domain-containing protein JA2L-like n=1 Tax=Phragmites australis TaxID=29695 RepID=UPI002D787DC8|nr:NAC domain-containing protein JA2L-like [Phragmites australis]